MTFSVQVEILPKKDTTLFRNLLTKKECDHLIKVATPFLRRSGTFSGSNDKRRTSMTAFSTNFSKDPVILKIRERCAALCGFPVSHVEPPQIVRYKPGEQFMNHKDNYPHSSPSFKKSGQRDYTFFIYLNEPGDESQTGGETEFTKMNFSVKPERGMAVFWRNINLITQDDDLRFYHCGKPPKGWIKWGMNVWIRHRPYRG